MAVSEPSELHGLQLERFVAEAQEARRRLERRKRSRRFARFPRKGRGVAGAGGIPAAIAEQVLAALWALLVYAYCSSATSPPPVAASAKRPSSDAAHPMPRLCSAHRSRASSDVVARRPQAGGRVHASVAKRSRRRGRPGDRGVAVALVSSGEVATIALEECLRRAAGLGAQNRAVRLARIEQAPAPPSAEKQGPRPIAHGGWRPALTPVAQVARSTSLMKRAPTPAFVLARVLRSTAPRSTAPGRLRLSASTSDPPAGETTAPSRMEQSSTSRCPRRVGGEIGLQHCVGGLRSAARGGSRPRGVLAYNGHQVTRPRMLAVGRAPPVRLLRGWSSYRSAGSTS